MSDDNEPEPLPCANCGRPLPDPLAPCRFCEGQDGRPDPPGAMETFRMHRKARALLFWGVESWPFALLAAYTAKRGLTLEEASLDPDLGMLRKLRRIFVLALLFAGLGIAYVIARWSNP